LIVATILVIVAVFVVIPEYQGYRPRSIVADAINDSMPLRARIEEFYRKSQTFPEGAEAAAFRLERDLTESRSVVWSPAERMLVVTMGDNMHRGKRFGWKPVPSSSGLEWKCSTIDLEPKYLPAACR
jgi:Tfp pilus assembly major pilin PilA